MTAQYPAPWAPPPPARPVPGADLSTDRVLSAHLVLWLGLLVAIPVAGRYTDDLIVAVFGQFSAISYLATLLALGTLPVALSLITLGRDLGRTLGGLGLLLTGGVVFILTLSAWAPSPILAVAVLVAAATGAWLLVRRRAWQNMFWGLAAGFVCGIGLLIAEDIGASATLFATTGEAIAVFFLLTLLPAIATAWLAVLTDRR